METPSTIRLVARSQTSTGSQKKLEDALSRSRGNTDRFALFDITNDSPIVGLASGSTERTPSSLAKNRFCPKQTPGSGEALLRGQVKTLLQMVEEEAVVVKMAPFTDRLPLRAMLGIHVSPAQLLAPTPANTPQIPGPEGVIVASKDDPVIPTEVKENPKLEEVLGECLINRALMFDDSPGKSDVSDCSTVSYQGSGASYREKSFEDDSSSVWSLQVNTNIQEEDEEETEDFDEEEDEAYFKEDDEECYDDLCDVLKEMSVTDEGRLPEFKGKHTKFVYGDDGEIECEEEDQDSVVSPGVLLLKGLPAPKGKHLRFPEEEQR